MEFDLPAFVSRLLEFETVDGREADAQRWLRRRLDALGFDTYEWTADAIRLSEHPSFPDDPAAIDVRDRPSVGGVLEFGDPDAGRTLVLNGHVDVVPADEERWETDPFEPVWSDDDGNRRLTARGAVDMKSGLGACLGAALDVRQRVTDGSGTVPLDGRVVVESVVGEEEGGIGAAAAALENPYPFARDAAIVAEPTRLRPVVASEGSLMVRLRLEGRSAHAATRWAGESVLPHFERIRQALEEFEADRAARVNHPLYEEYPVPWPVVVGTVRSGSWASTVPSGLTAHLRVGVAPGETVDAVEAELRETVRRVAMADPWTAEHPPSLERFSVQFEPCEIDPEEPIVRAIQCGIDAAGLSAGHREPRGVTYGADVRHLVDAGIPAVLFGPGDVLRAHFPGESIAWSEVETARKAIGEAAVQFLREESDVVS
ncbi:MAG: M20/M25/M40 family metallo-hydrolase [Haloferacaceae archaeon]